MQLERGLLDCQDTGDQNFTAVSSEQLASPLQQRQPTPVQSPVPDQLAQSGGEPLTNTEVDSALRIAKSLTDDNNASETE